MLHERLAEGDALLGVGDRLLQTDPRGGDALDRVVNGLSKIAPAA